MGGFPPLQRDVLRWLITLNLSQPIKNVRRDFSNGFLVAEIFSQYFPQDIQMHSFDNGTKLAKKKDNWGQLARVFRKKDFPVSSAEIDNIINCGSEDGIGPFLERMYWFLARKSSKPQEPHIEDLWTGLPDAADTSLLPTTATVSKPVDDETRFNDLHSSMALSNAPETSTTSLDKDHRLRDSTDSYLNAGHKNTGKSEEEQQQNDRKQSQGSRKKALNAVERARQKEMKEIARTKSPASRKQSREGADRADPALAFRSPKRERHFKSYTLTDYKRQQALGYVVLGKLGPDSTEELRAKRDTLEKMKEFGRSARTIVENRALEPRKQKTRPLSTREKALKFATTVPKPKKKTTSAGKAQESKDPVVHPLTELEILEAKYQADKQNVEAMRRDLEIFLR